MKVNTEGICVMQISWLPGWQWQVWNEQTVIMQGSAATKDKAWENARYAVTALKLIPKGQG